MGEPQTFEVTDQHLTLLRHAYVGWDGCEFGAPAINCKRPYGNGDVYSDIGDLLDIEPIEDVNYGGEYHFTQAQQELMNNLHAQTRTALQIILTTGEFRPGYYEAPAYTTKWKRVST